MSLFLESFMTFARAVTHADRSMVVDETLTAVASHNLNAEALTAANFQQLAADVLAEALRSGQPIITNNMVTNPLDAPTTNVSFNDLRIVVAIPLITHGAVYLDRSVKQGVFTRDQVDQLMQFGLQLIQGGHTNLTADEMQQQFSAP